MADANRINMRRLRDDSPRVNEYYEAAAGRFRAVKALTWVLLVAYALLVAAAFHSYFTLDNFRYMLKDLDGGSASAENGAWETVVYDSLADADFKLFRGDLAVAGASRLSLYNSSGNRLFSDTRAVKFPVMATSAKYMLVYDLGGGVYTLYNSFTSVLTAETDYAIYGGDICDEGSFAVITAARDSKFVVELFDRHFKSSAKIYKNKYVTGVALRNDGGEVAVISVDISGNAVAGEVMLVEKNSDTAKATHTLRGAMPLKAHYFGDGSLIVVCDTGIYFYGGDGEQSSFYPASEGELTKTAFTPSSAAAVFAANIVGNENIILLFDTDGDIIYNSTVNERIDDVAASANENGDRVTLCLLTASSALRVRLSNGAEGWSAAKDTALHGSGYTRVLIDGSDNVLICGPTSASQIFIDNSAAVNAGTEAER